MDVTKWEWYNDFQWRVLLGNIDFDTLSKSFGRHFPCTVLVVEKWSYLNLCIHCAFHVCFCGIRNVIWYNMYKKQKLRDLSLPVHLLWSEQYLNNIAVPLLLECTGTLQDAWKYKCQKITNQLKRYIPTSIDVKMSIKKRF